MALIVGTNSYITAADADAYLSDRLYADAWTNAGPADRDKALITATRVIERQALSGKPATDAQTLSFPRAYPPDVAFRLNIASSLYANPINAYDGPLQLDRTFGYGYPQRWVAQTAVPQDVLDAVCEEALARLEQSSESRDRRQLQHEGVVAIKVAERSESYSTDGMGRSVKPRAFASPEAKDRLRPYLAGSVRIA